MKGVRGEGMFDRHPPQTQMQTPPGIRGTHPWTQRQTSPAETATEAGGTHPTGTHSCHQTPPHKKSFILPVRLCHGLPGCFSLDGGIRLQHGFSFGVSIWYLPFIYLPKSGTKYLVFIVGHYQLTRPS